MWNAHKRDKPKGQTPRVGAKDDDLTRAMASETGTGKPAPNTGTLGIGGGHAGSWTGGGKLDRPIIPGGCNHTGVKLSIVLSDGKRLYGAQAHAIKDTAHLALIVDCAGLLKPRPRFVAKATAPRFRTLDTSAYPDVVTLTWPDMTAPTHVGIKFWQRLRDLLPDDTAVCCMGGHGRTGTALAALLVADGETADTAIKRVRTEHCGRAIETQGQVDYIKRLQADRDKLVKGAK